MKIGLALAAFVASLPVLTAAGPAEANTQPSSSGPILWQDVRLGMTEQDLRAKHPGVKRSDRGTLVQEEVNVAGAMFSAYFEFSNGRVSGVQLQASNIDDQNVIDGLSSKYGAPSSPYGCDAPSSPYRQCTAVWHSSSGIIVKLSTLIAPSLSLTAIKYAPADVNGL